MVGGWIASYVFIFIFWSRCCCCCCLLLLLIRSGLTYIMLGAIRTYLQYETIHHAWLVVFALWNLSLIHISEPTRPY